MADKYQILKSVYGYDKFRPAQEELIDNILSGKDVLGVMPTGAGKSVCFQVPALLMTGITIVISPLISLMADQVNSLTQAGVRAAYLNSSLTLPQQRQVLSNIRRGMYKIIYVAPERLDTEGFASLAADINISMIAVDEAHCISQWGQDFRPSYMNIVSFADSLPYRPVISAFTATATQRVRDDISSILKLNDPFTVITGFDRSNLYFGVISDGDRYTSLKKLVDGYEGKSGIVYCSTRKNVEMIAEKLCSDGISAAAYHAGMPDELRSSTQDDFIYDRIQIIVATNAFGMGIDKSNVSFVIHYNMPKDMESYYQEAGRAGRDGSPAECTLLYSGQDYQLNKFLIEKSSEESDADETTKRILINRDMKRLGAMMDYCSGTGCLRKYILRYFGEHSDEFCGNCSFCISGSEKTDVTVDAQKILSCIARMNQRYGVKMVVDTLKGSHSEKLLSLGLDSLSTYGIMKDSSEDRIRIIINNLISNGHIRREGDEYPVLKLTAKAAAVLKGEEQLEINMPKAKKPARVKKSEAEEYNISPQLLSKLKSLRSELAAREKVPAYVIFSDVTIRDMCAKLPQSRNEMLDVSGIGSKKLEKYGDQFLKIITEHIKTTGGAVRITNSDRSAMEKPVHAIADKISAFVPSEEACSLTQLCDMLISITEMNIKTKPVRTIIGDWLVREEYLCESTDSKGHSFKDTTFKSESIGIIKISKVGKAGTPYTSVVYTPKAQKFIAENIADIAETE
ncbi:MAG: DNA helicase RecQ [Oscillospiraceae bacterium]|nr:DNA helicase RecQ [Oscillospiraceae bacterium]